MFSITSIAAGSRVTRGLLGLAAGIAAIALPATAQVDLSVTEADSGSLQVAAQPGNNGFPVALGCSLSSPQFSNTATYSGASGCIQTATIWISNVGATPTPVPGLITVKIELSPVQPKGSTVLAANGYCAYTACGGNLAVTAGIWACNGAVQGVVTCTTGASISPSANAGPIVIKYTREDFSPPSTWSDRVTVSGTVIFTTGDPNTRTFENAPLAWNIIQQSTFPTDGRYVTIHSVPEGLLVAVDGALVRTPHTDYWQAGSTHSVDGDAGNGVAWGLPFGQAGTQFPNFPYVLNNVVPVIASITGTKKDTGIPSVIWSTLPPDVITGTTNYEAITFLYHKP